MFFWKNQSGSISNFIVNGSVVSVKYLGSVSPVISERSFQTIYMEGTLDYLLVKLSETYL